MIKHITIMFCSLAAFSGVSLAEQAPSIFSMPVLEGWRTETIPFPLEFAPSLPYEGLEEVRFSPGMFQEGSEDFWTYAFVWWVTPDGPNDAKLFSAYLEAYFRGLSTAVATSRKISVADATFSAAIDAGKDGTFSGTVETFDAFATGGQIRLNVHGNVLQCPQQDRQAIFFGFSPQAPGHAVWKQLNAIRDGFRCTASEGT